jgi:hypothetical protein
MQIRVLLIAAEILENWSFLFFAMGEASQLPTHRLNACLRDALLHDVQ